MPNQTNSRKKMFRFAPKHRSLAEVLSDHELAALGDAYVNLIWSLYLSIKKGKPVGKKANSTMLASALRKARLRGSLPSRTDRHKQADAAEALIAYAWLNSVISLEEAVLLMEKGRTPEEAFSMLLQSILERLNLT